VTVWVSGDDVLALKAQLDAAGVYVAVIAWLPTVRVEVLKVAWPVLSSGTEDPRGLIPSLNCTVPQVTAALPGPVTAAVKVTLWPYTEGLDEGAMVVVVAALLTVCVSAGEELVLKLLSPLKVAVMLWLPGAV
jgi:hypothetical protein